jgi:HlyD family secretion protein
MPGRSKRTLWIVLTLIVVASVVGVVLALTQSRTSTARYETVIVDRGRIVAKVSATGTVSALVTVQVGSQVSGRIQQIFVDYNSPVTKGQLIAKIDPQLFEAAVEQARANHFAAQGNLTKAKAQALDAERQYRRTRALAERQLIAQAEVDTAETNFAVAKAQIEAAKGSVEQTQAALHQAQINLAYTNIVSPTNGVVISRNVDVGQTVAASLQAPTLFLIAEDLSKMQVDTSVAEADVGKLRAGMPATFTVDAYPGERFTGAVRQIRNAPQVVQNVVTYDAVIDVENAELKLKPGMTANVTFVYADKDNVVRLPNAALRFRPPATLLARTQSERGKSAGQMGAPAGPDHRTVWVLRNDAPQAVPIRIGLTDGTVTEVADGQLHAGDRVVTDVADLTDESRPTPSAGPGSLRRVF